MKNYVQDGDSLSVVAPYNVDSGAGVLVGAIFGIAICAAVAGASLDIEREGVYTLAKTSAQEWTFGQKVYWDDANKRCDTDSTVGPLIGAAASAASNPSTQAAVVLNGTIPFGLEGAQAAIADIAVANATDAATAATLANACKATLNALLAELRIIGIIKST
ncbi:DUF2190 family protein [Undibacterium sp. CY21W]|uniref:DUF2190 family protein n=1 Tax=Undibacterium sp. CY21W TaxID=2762293 RepID=UPI00164B2036|nr:capsid cement protein [Undibacterium sp. CY21W]MBC3927779.1 DUF2190 family protein [Undibacterium sp. CY21W]